MRDSSLRKLTAEEYAIEEDKFFKRNTEYFNNKCRINSEEHKEIENIKEGETFSEKSDIYFEKYPELVEKYERQREENYQKYQRFSSIYYTDFYTELTEEYIEKRKETYPESLDLDTMNHLLQELKELKGHHFIAGKDDDKFELLFIGVQVDDFYYVGVNDKGEYCWYSAVCMPDFID